jgi:hypothetical protein
VHELATGHEAMVTAPEQLAGVLADIAGALPDPSAREET